MKTRLAAHEAPREFEFMDEFPSTVTGKIMRRELRAREEAKGSREVKNLAEAVMIEIGVFHNGASDLPVLGLPAVYASTMAILPRCTNRISARW